MWRRRQLLPTYFERLPIPRRRRTILQLWATCKTSDERRRAPTTDATVFSTGGHLFTIIVDFVSDAAPYFTLDARRSFLSGLQLIIYRLCVSVSTASFDSEKKHVVLWRWHSRPSKSRICDLTGRKRFNMRSSDRTRPNPPNLIVP